MKTLSKDAFREMLEKKKKILILTGAGVSAESGIATFRGSTSSWWTGVLGYPILGLFGTSTGWNTLPWFCWTMVNRFFRIPAMHATPNACHRFLGDLDQQEGKWVRIITQNVDGLHQRGGTPSNHIAEIHGTIWRMRCRKDPTQILSETIPSPSMTPGKEEEWPSHLHQPCPFCGGTCARPDVTLFGDRCPEEQCNKAWSFVNEFTSVYGSEADDSMMLIIGTSGMVNTIFGYIGQVQCADKYIVLIDPHPSPKMIQFVNVVVQEPAGVVFS